MRLILEKLDTLSAELRDMRVKQREILEVLVEIERMLYEQGRNTNRRDDHNRNDESDDSEENNLGAVEDGMTDSLE